MTVTNIETARERLFAEIDRREGELIELIQQLVRCKSTLGNEAEPQQIIADYIRESGVEPDVWDLNDAVLALPGAGNSGVPFAGRPNVAAVYPGVGNGRSLILNGHIDVVSSEPDTNWTRDPWAASIEGRRMYGRGAYDMKCGTALNVFLARLIRDLDIQLGGDLIVESIIEEECTGNGALAACFRDGAIRRATAPTRQSSASQPMDATSPRMSASSGSASTSSARALTRRSPGKVSTRSIG